MCGEDRLDQQPVEQRLQLGGRDPRLAQVTHRGLDRLGGRAARGVGLALAAPQHAHALALLGEVHELEVGGERLQHAARLGERQAFDAAHQLLPRRLVAGAVRLRERAHLLDEVVERPALLLDERLAEQVAEPVDLLAEPVALPCH